MLVLRGQTATICSPCPAPATVLLQGLRDAMRCDVVSECATKQAQAQKGVEKREKSIEEEREEKPLEAGATLQGLCRKGYAEWGYAARARLQESWIMADDDDGW